MTVACSCGDLRLVTAVIPTTSRSMSLCFGCGEVRITDDDIVVAKRMESSALAWFRSLDALFSHRRARGVPR